MSSPAQVASRSPIPGRKALTKLRPGERPPIPLRQWIATTAPWFRCQQRLSVGEAGGLVGDVPVRGEQGVAGQARRPGEFLLAGEPEPAVSPAVRGLTRTLMPLPGEIGTLDSQSPPRGRAMVLGRPGPLRRIAANSGRMVPPFK